MAVEDERQKTEEDNSSFTSSNYLPASVDASNQPGYPLGETKNEWSPWKYNYTKPEERAKSLSPPIESYAIKQKGNYAVEVAFSSRRPVVELSPKKMQGAYGFMFPYHLDSPIFVADNLGKKKSEVVVHEWSHTMELDEAKNRDKTFELCDGNAELHYSLRINSKGYG